MRAFSYAACAALATTLLSGCIPYPTSSPAVTPGSAFSLGTGFRSTRDSAGVEEVALDVTLGGQVGAGGGDSSHAGIRLAGFGSLASGLRGELYAQIPTPRRVVGGIGVMRARAVVMPFTSLGWRVSPRMILYGTHGVAFHRKDKDHDDQHTRITVIGLERTHYPGPGSFDPSSAVKVRYFAVVYRSAALVESRPGPLSFLGISEYRSETPLRTIAAIGVSADFIR